MSRNDERYLFLIFQMQLNLVKICYRIDHFYQNEKFIFININLAKLKWKKKYLLDL